MSGVHRGSVQPAPTLRSAIDSLREAVRLRQVVPVIGPEALTVRIKGVDGIQREAPFYRLVAERLLEQNGLGVDLLDAHSAAWDLHRASATVIGHSRVPAARLRRSIAAVIRELTAQVQPAGALASIAKMNCFDLVVCLTPDELVLKALATSQPAVIVEVRSYAPRADSSQDPDIPTSRIGAIRLFHPLGRAEAATEFAIHEEDALEYLYRFRDEGERRAKELLTALRCSDLLFLGCGLPDWMGRGLMRLVNDQRLSASERTMEFFCASARDAALTGFLDRFSPNSTVFPWEPNEFISEISGWCEASSNSRAASYFVPESRTNACARSPSVFISYASENREAAQRLAEELQRIGFGDIWLDRRRLVAGDDWSLRIDEAIDTCDYFVPLLSHEADQRREGVFWEEWRKALARSLRINDCFILPVGIDALPPAQMRYERIFNGVTRSFSELHLTHAPIGALGGEASDQFQRRVLSFICGAGRG